MLYTVVNEGIEVLVCKRTKVSCCDFLFLPLFTKILEEGGTVSNGNRKS